MSETTYDVVALGELLVDFAHISSDSSGYPTLKAQPGGAPANFLAALQEYGCKTALISKVGDDTFGRLLTNTLDRLGVETKGIIKDNSVFTTLAFVTLDSSGNRSFSFARKPGADTLLNTNEVNTYLLENCKVFHFGSLSLTDEPSRTATEFALTYAKERHKYISFDPNLRIPLWSSENEARTQINWGLQQADIVKISDEEIDFLWGISPQDGAQKLLKEYGVRLVYATMGAKGCYYANPLCCGNVPCPIGIKVIDTTGAGDIFGGSAMSKFIKRGKSPESLFDEELYSITRFACYAASLSTTTHGSITSVVPEKDVINILIN